MHNKENQKIAIGKILKSTRKSLGLTQEYVSEQLGFAPRYISDIERDKTKGSIDTLIKLCNLYNITPTYVLQKYLNQSDNNENAVVGFSYLSKEEQEFIITLIEFMNHKKFNN